MIIFQLIKYCYYYDIKVYVYIYYIMKLKQLESLLSEVQPFEAPKSK